MMEKIKKTEGKELIMCEHDKTPQTMWHMWQQSSFYALYSGSIYLKYQNTPAVS